MSEKVKNEAANEVRELTQDEIAAVAGGYHFVIPWAGGHMPWGGGFGSRPPNFNPAFPGGFGGPIAGGPINEPGFGGGGIG